MTGFFKKLSGAVIAVLVTLLCVPSAFAATPLDPTKSCTLTLTSMHEGQAIPGMQVSIYRIATISAQGDYTVADTFKNYPINFNTADPNEWASIALSLSGFVVRDSVAAFDVATTDASGKVSFPQSAARLEQGLYLVVASTTAYNNNIYTAAASIVSVPQLNAAQTEWDYDVIAQLKLVKEPQFQTKSISVVKEWIDTFESTSSRPVYITVDLLQDETVVDTVVLSADNAWQHTWDNLDSAYRWSVVERVPSGYNVSTSQQNNTFVITNTFVPSTPPPLEKPPQQSLPKTGVLWWPVPVFFFIGMLLLLLGRKQAGKHKS